MENKKNDWSNNGGNLSFQDRQYSDRLERYEYEDDKRWAEVESAIFIADFVRRHG